MIAMLWQMRYRPPLGSRRWLKYWAKRGRLARQLLGAEWSMRRFARRCRSLGDRTLISPSNIEGELGRLSVGSDCAIGRVHIQLHAPVTIGNCVVINDGCRLLTGTHNLLSPGWELIASPIAIEDYAWIATDAILLPGVTIGRGAIVGAGAVVSRPVESLAIVAGNPARMVGQRTREELSYRPSQASALFEAWLGPVDNPQHVHSSD
jgi:maltose O-acetyltransferase